MSTPDLSEVQDGRVTQAVWRDSFSGRLGVVSAAFFDGQCQALRHARVCIACPPRLAAAPTWGALGSR